MQLMFDENKVELTQLAGPEVVEMQNDSAAFELSEFLHFFSIQAHTAFWLIDSEEYIWTTCRQIKYSPSQPDLKLIVDVIEM